LRVNTYSKFWMPILGAMLALMIASIVRPLIAGRRAKRDEQRDEPERRSVDALLSESPTPAEVN
jgi:hypothetical protein